MRFCNNLIQKERRFLCTTQATKQRRICEIYVETVVRIFPESLASDCSRGTWKRHKEPHYGTQSRVVSSFQFQTIAEEHSALARVTVYWRGTASGAGAAWNRTRLREGAIYPTMTRRQAGCLILLIVSLSSGFTRNRHPLPPRRKSITQGTGSVW